MLSRMHNLGLAYFVAGKFDRAVALFEQTLSARTAKLGSNHKDSLASKSHLAMALVHFQRFDRALPMLEQVLAVETAKYGRDKSETCADTSRSTRQV